MLTFLKTIATGLLVGGILAGGYLYLGPAMLRIVAAGPGQ